MRDEVGLGFALQDVHTVLVTHSHPDHFGSAGRLADEAEADLVTHSAFRLWWTEDPNDPCEQVHDVDPEDLPTSNPWDTNRTPWGAPRHMMMGPRPEYFSGTTFRTPSPTVRLKDGDRLVLGDREWWAVHTPGHTLDHLCLYDAEEGTFLSGDHVLPQITPHISGIAAGRDPLGTFVSSLDKVAGLPGARRVLPAHGLEFDDLAGRVESIKHHHAERLDKVISIGLASGPSRVEAFTRELFRPAVWGPMADSETYAHLEHLRAVGMVERTEDSEGHAIYRIVEKERPQLGADR